MHIGRKYKFSQFLGWTGWEAGYLIGWSLLVTLFLQLTQWNFLTIPAPILTIIGSALAIILAFKNQQCYARFNDALVIAGQLSGNSLILAHKLKSAIGSLDAVQSGPLLKEFFHRHLALLTVLRFSLRERKPWENTSGRGNARFLAELPTPESRSTLESELKTYLPEADAQKVLTHRGDKEGLILRWQYEAISDLYNRKLISELILTVLSAALDDVAKSQGGLKRIKNYPYARNFYSIAVFLVLIYAAAVPFGLFPYAQELGRSAGIGQWTAWLNVPFSALVGWIFVSLEKVGENSSNPFEGGPNDVPISSIARRVEIEMRTMLGEETDLKPIEAKQDVLF
jgi:ion channel-forming bestrophin family protein